jgi:hypothetical protein
MRMQEKEMLQYELQQVHERALIDDRRKREQIRWELRVQDQRDAVVRRSA